MTLIEVLVTLAVMAVLALMSFLALERLASGKTSLLQAAQEQRRLLLIQAQIERDLQPLNRMQPNERVAALALGESLLRTPVAEWSWSEKGLYRREFSAATGQAPTQYWSGPLRLGMEYLAVGGVPDQRAPIGPGVANPRAVELVIERSGQRLTRLFYIGPLE
jgi:prepilin-type N-terminal cleavage/methylation domain-containing protein